MYISRLSVHGYKNTCQKSVISLNKGLNILLGENGCGKTTIITFTFHHCEMLKQSYPPEGAPDLHYCSKCNMEITQILLSAK